MPGGGGDNTSTSGSAAGGPLAAGGSGDAELGMWGEEDTELIRSCGLLSSALGLQKSFSTSDIVGADTGSTSGEHSAARAWASEVRGRDTYINYY